jgi:FemAB-related protein (PEP-CTERM system-associated)
MIERLEGHDPRDVAAWDEYVARSPGATCHHRYAWRPIAERVYRLETAALVSRPRPGGAIRGVLPLFVVPRPFRRYVTTGMFGAYGPILADDDETRRELLQAACRYTEQIGAQLFHAKILGEPPDAHGLFRQDLWVTARLDLTGGVDALWRRLRKSIRAAVRQAERCGLSVRWGRGAASDFYDVLAENMHRKGSPIYGRALLEAILDAFGDAADVATVWVDGRAIGGALTIAFDGTMYVPFASSRASAFRLRPNNLLYFRVAERAAALGLSGLDFGSSPRGTTTLDFKLHWGAVTVPITSLVHVPGAQKAPSVDASSPAIQAGVRLWKRLPRAVADALGPHVSRLMV